MAMIKETTDMISVRVGDGGEENCGAIGSGAIDSGAIDSGLKNLEKGFREERGCGGV